MDELRKRDPAFSELVAAVSAESQEAGALDPKTKVLISLALDAAGSHPDGVRNLAIRARTMGVKDEDIIGPYALSSWSPGYLGWWPDWLLSGPRAVSCVSERR